MIEINNTLVDGCYMVKSSRQLLWQLSLIAVQGSCLHMGARIFQNCVNIHLDLKFDYIELTMLWMVTTRSCCG